MSSVGASRLKALETTGEKERIIKKVIIEVVEYELAQLNSDKRICRRHAQGKFWVVVVLYTVG
jgi:phosphoribosyl-ATP pyrophosphohydrolase